MMNWLRNTRPGRLLTDFSMGTAVVLPGAGVAGLAFNAEPVTADNVPTRQAAPEAVASKAIPDCALPDSGSKDPQWHGKYSFNTPNGRHSIHSIRPGGLTRFVARVAGGNLTTFQMEVNESPVHRFPKAIKVLKRGSHPGWYTGGGNPNWTLKDLCHWNEKRRVSFLVKVSQDAQIGKQLCMPFDVWARTKDVTIPMNPPVWYRCLKIR
jgi:hypothetical protein